jgi:hypothetical protein
MRCGIRRRQGFSRRAGTRVLSSLPFGRIRTRFVGPAWCCKAAMVPLRVMVRWSSRRLLMLLLGGWLALGLSLSPAQATTMAAKMAAAGDVIDDSAVHDCCDGCDGADNSSVTDNCLPLCAAPAVALPASPVFAVDRHVADCTCRAQIFPPDRSFAPDLRPPRSLLPA